jgi:hypothetical protein
MIGYTKFKDYTRTSEDPRGDEAHTYIPGPARYHQQNNPPHSSE